MIQYEWISQYYNGDRHEAGGSQTQAILIVWNHLYEVQEHTKLIYGDWNQKMVGSWDRVDYLKNWKGAQRNFCGLMKMFSIFFGWRLHACIQLSKVIELK